MIYKNWLHETVKALVDSPEHIKINEVRGEQTFVIELRVSKKDVGKVIGKEGRLAQAMRTLLKAMAVKHRDRVLLEVIDDEQ